MRDCKEDNDSSTFSTEDAFRFRETAESLDTFEFKSEREFLRESRN